MRIEIIRRPVATPALALRFWSTKGGICIRGKRPSVYVGSATFISSILSILKVRSSRRIMQKPRTPM